MRAIRLLSRFLLVLLVVAGAGLLLLRWHRRFPRGIVIHHSASRMFDGTRPIGAEDIERWHAARGFGTVFRGKTYHIGYHYVIRADGKIEPGRPELCRGSHATRGNDCLGICVVGDFSSRDNPRGAKGPLRPTLRQMESLTRLCRALMAKYHLPVSSIRSHTAVDGDTECPGDRFPFARLLASLRRPRANTQTPAGRTDRERVRRTEREVIPPRAHGRLRGVEQVT